MTFTSIAIATQRLPPAIPQKEVENSTNKQSSLFSSQEKQNHHDYKKLFDIKVNDYYQQINENKDTRPAFAICMESCRKAQEDYRYRVVKLLEDPQKPQFLPRLNLAYQQRIFEIKLANANFDAVIQKFPKIKEAQDEMKKYQNIVAHQIIQEMNEDDY